MLTRLVLVFLMNSDAEYFQGMVDLFCPFVIVFLSQFAGNEIELLDLDEMPGQLLQRVESNVYWTFHKFHSTVPSGQIFTDKGTARMLNKFEYLMRWIDRQNSLPYFFVFSPSFLNLYSFLEKHRSCNILIRKD